jgi:hypothetical protein
VLLAADRVVVLDWPHASIGAAWADLVFFAPSVAMQGGPAPAELARRYPPIAAAARARFGPAIERARCAGRAAASLSRLSARAGRPSRPGHDRAGQHGLAGQARDRRRAVVSLSPPATHAAVPK